MIKIITEYEQGKAIPNNQLIAKMERALGTIFNLFDLISVYMFFYEQSLLVFLSINLFVSLSIIRLSYPLA